MLTKIKFALSTALVLGFASGALAQADPEVNLIRRDLSLAPSVQRQVPATASAAYATVRQPVQSFTAEEKEWFERASRPGW